jgi:hypothetical protein
MTFKVMTEIKKASNDERLAERIRRWRSPLAVLAAGGIAFTALSGLSILLLPFSVANQVVVLVHTVAGVLLLLPVGWYMVRHLRHYWRSPWSHILVSGYTGGAALLLCLLSGVVLTWQAALSTHISYGWDLTHIITTFVILAFGLPHLLVLIRRDRKAAPGIADPYGQGALLYTLGGLAVVALAAYGYPRVRLTREFPADYSFKYGKDRPFAPSLARTETNRALDDRLLAGSRSCGTAGCHEQIVQEWEPSAHRYAAMDTGFQAIQMNMAQQNGPESTRYCGGCHDPLSLFSGTKNLYTDTQKLSSLRGYQEGVSCLACHSIRKVDVKGNANFSIAEPARYLFELEFDRNPRPATRFVRDFLIRAYPRQHVKDLSKRLFKAPEYCAACHKQFIDQEVNNVGWVQLQNQYDNWRQSRWNHPDNPRKTIECRECHMPLVESQDPAAGDANDYNRSLNDGKHRSHRFVGANQMMPALLQLPGWQKHVELVEKWLRGKYEIPEIADKWRSGPAVAIEMLTPEKVRPGETVPVRVIITSNKVGHDYPTGPLDIIQSWVELLVTDDRGAPVFHSGRVDPRGFIQPGTFMFKAEPVDQSGNLIDRHNLWEMVGVRHRRALFPGFSDTAEFHFRVPTGKGTEFLRAEARLRYRKIDQFLLNFMFGEKKGLTSPITDLAAETRRIEVSHGPATGPTS